MTTNARLYAVRGAVCCVNTTESVSTEVPLLYAEILSRNSITEEDIVSVLFSVTGDITVMNPATALRAAGMASSVPLLACTEQYFVGGLPRVIRVLLTFYGTVKPVPVYRNGAEVLRPDLDTNASAHRSTE